MITIKQKVHFSRGKAGRRRIATEPPATETVPMGRVPRVSKLMALAIRFDRLIREGKVADQSELARLAHVTQPRMTQIMNLLHLAPDIQEESVVSAAGDRGAGSNPREDAAAAFCRGLLGDAAGGLAGDPGSRRRRRVCSVTICVFF